MTINLANNDPRVSYSVAEGVTQTSFTVPFEFFADADLNVYVDGTLKTLTTDYTVTGGNGSTGTVTISVTGASGGSTVVITRTIDLERTTDFPTSGPFDVNSLNTELDKQVAMIADLKDKTDRALQLTDYDADVSLVLPDVDTRKGKTLAFNSSTGAVEAGPSIGDVQAVSAASADIATLADIEDGTDATDAIQTVAGISANVTTVAGVAANVTTVAGISSAVSTVAADSADIQAVAPAATDIGTVATNIANVNTVAGQTTNLQNVTDNLTAIQNASSNASAAAASAAAAANSYDQFDDRYLGSKASNPTLDNDGNALVAGALYFNSTENEMRVYDGAQWIAASAAQQSTFSLFEYTATAAQTTFSGADDNAATLAYTAPFIIVAMNGVILDPSDYTATNGTSVVLASGAALNDIVNIYAFGSFSVADTVAASTGGTFNGGITATSFTGDGSGLTGIQAGAGYFQGENGATGDTTNGKGDIFRVHEQQLDTNTTIASGDNAGCFFNLTVATGVTLTVNGNLVIA